MNDIISMFVRREGLSMATVVVKNGNVDGALRTLKQKNAKDGSSKKVRERQEGYLKPGAKRRKETKTQAMATPMAASSLRFPIFAT